MPDAVSLGFSLNQAKDLFLTSKNVQAAVAASRRRILMRSGAMVRKIARSSIKKTKFQTIKGPKSAAKPYVHEYLKLRATVSRAGQPPKTHADSGQFGIKTIVFVYDAPRDRVLIGPVGRSSNFTVPDALELGGTSVTRVPRWARSRTGTSKIRKTIQARPFMNPALEKFSKVYPELWRNAVRPTGRGRAA